jgi:hypothetical protein
MSTINLLESAPNQFQKVGDIRFAYRKVGTASGVPVIFRNHLGAVLDNFDPRIVGGRTAISTGVPHERALTKGNENLNHRFHRFTQIFLFSAFSASLRFVTFVGELS